MARAGSCTAARHTRPRASELALNTELSEIIPPGNLNGRANGADHDNDLEPRIVATNSTAYKVLEDNMHFHQVEAEKLLDDIRKILPQVNHPVTSKHLCDAIKVLVAHKARASDDAHKLINYQNPKLAVIDQRNTTTHRFVIKAPMPTVNPNEWLAQADKVLKQVDQEAADRLVTTLNKPAGQPQLSAPDEQYCDPAEADMDIDNVR